MGTNTTPKARPRRATVDAVTAGGIMLSRGFTQAITCRSVDTGTGHLAPVSADPFAAPNVRGTVAHARATTPLGFNVAGGRASDR